MGRLNNVDLFGVVQELPQVVKNDETGEYVRALGSLRVIRGARNAQDGKRYMVFSYPKIYTRNPDWCKEMETWQVNDLVFINGMFATNAVMKTSFCSCCGAKNRKEGQLGYVEPISMRTIDRFNSETEAISELKNYTLVSNRIFALGNLGKDPKRMKLHTQAGKNIVVCQYPMVLNRLFYVKEDPAEKTNDFPWVKSYGKNCDSDYFRLKESSTVMIDGFLQTRFVRMHSVCDYCGEPYDWKDSTMEIVPYEVEYLQRYRTEEEAADLQMARHEQSAKDIIAALKLKAGVDSVDESGISDGEVTDMKELA